MEINKSARTLFVSAISAMLFTREQFAAGSISPLESGRSREKCLANALAAMAQVMGVKLQRPLTIDTNGEFAITAIHAEGVLGGGVTGHYGAEFAERINRYGPRCGLLPTAVMSPDSGWCRLNHFQAERMVMDYYNQTMSMDS